MTAPHPGIDVLATRIGALAWVSDTLFVLEGRWAADMGDDAAAIHLGTHSRHHGWHGALWRDVLPDSPALDASARIVAPPGWVAALATVATVEGDAARLAALYRGLLPRLVVLLDELADRSGGPGGRVIRRQFGFVRADVLDDLAGGLGLLLSRLGDAAARLSAESVVRSLDALFAGAASGEGD